MTRERIISRADQDEMELLPHGTVITIPGSTDVLTMNREDLPDPFFTCQDGSWLRWHHVFEFYGVETVKVDLPEG